MDEFTYLIVIDDLITCPAFLATKDEVVSFSILDNEAFAGGSFHTFTQLVGVDPGNSLETAQREGSVFFHGKGERVISIDVIREELTEFADGVERFHLASDSGVVISLETMVIAIQRRGFDGFDFVFRSADSLANLEYYPTSHDWPLNLRVTYDYSRNLIPIA